MERDPVTGPCALQLHVLCSLGTLFAAMIAASTAASWPSPLGAGSDEEPAADDELPVSLPLLAAPPMCCTPVCTLNQQAHLRCSG